MPCSLYAAADLKRGTAAYYGYYDQHNQIVVSPSLHLPPHVVVEHEITHVNITNNSTLGLFEQVVLFAQNLAYGRATREAAERLWNGYGAVVQQRCELVHEAAAWYGTELKTAGFEDKTAPGRYAPLVRRVRRAVERHDLPPFVTAATHGAGRLDLVEDAAIFALSPPVVRQWWADPGAVTPHDVQRALRSADNDPMPRFEALLDWLGTQPTEQVLAWSRSRQPKGEDPAAPQPTRRHWLRSTPLPASRRRDLAAAGTVALVEHVVRQAEAVPGQAHDDLTDVIGLIWGLSELTERFEVHVDRYAQVCVLQPGGSRHIPIDEGSDPPAGLDRATRLIVGVAPPEQTMPTHLPYGDHAHVIYDVSDHQSRVWIGESATVHRELVRRHGTVPVIASSRGYDLSTCTLGGVLDDIPHVVMAPTDFRSMWFRLAGSGGLGGCPVIEYDVLRSPRLGDDYGYLLLKGADRPDPILIVPIVAPAAARIVAHAEGASPDGIELRRAGVARGQWVGPLARHVMAAAQAFESE